MTALPAALRGAALPRAASLALGLLVAGCGSDKPGEPWNVLLVVVDTLRSDRMSLYGYARPTTPNLEALARQAVVFENARSQAGCTYPSVNSLLTSRLPSRFLLGKTGTMGIPEEIRSLPEILRQHGYATAAVSASIVVRANPSSVNPAGGFDRGFLAFDERCLRKRAPCVNGRGLDLAAGLRQPWFLYLHYLEPHAPYQPPEDHPLRFAAPLQQAREQGVHGWAQQGEVRPVVRRLYHGEEQFEYNPRDLAYLSDLYDEEIAYFDQQFAVLLAALSERGLLDRTLLVFASDHGEELYEHGDWSHCRDLAYDTVLATPLLLRIPGTAQGLRRKAAVENLDIVPTLLDYLGLPAGDLPFDGQSLRPVIEEDRPIRRLTFGNQGRHRTVADGAYKLLFDLAAGGGRLFDLRTDPGETTDVAGERPAEAERLRELLRRWIESTEGPAAESVRRADELEKQLRAVGYL
jgi:arylsulfatase A-like enzyme